MALRTFQKYKKRANNFLLQIVSIVRMFYDVLNGALLLLYHYKWDVDARSWKNGFINEK